MPNRYSITLAPEKLKIRFNLEVAEDYRPRYNAAPGQLLPVIVGNNPGQLHYFHWGTIPDWSKNKTISQKLLMAQWETMKEKPAFQRNLMQARCLVAADGFYLWKSVGKKRQIPYRFTLNNGEGFSIAGLWEEYENDHGEMVRTFKIITVNGNKLVQQIDQQMPAILSKEDEANWLNTEATMDELQQSIRVHSSDDMTMYSVSPKLNNISEDDISMIQPAPAADQFGNYSLFD